MEVLQEVRITCPTCGEPNSILLDASAGDQQYIEDCQVCCRPIVLQVRVPAAGDCRVEARHENDA
jgi:transposase-like protein